MVACTGLELPPPHTVLALPSSDLGWGDPHWLQQGDDGHHDDHLLGGKKGCLLLS